MLLLALACTADAKSLRKNGGKALAQADAKADAKIDAANDATADAHKSDGIDAHKSDGFDWAASASSKKRNRPRSTPLRSSDDEISD